MYVFIMFIKNLENPINSKHPPKTHIQEFAKMTSPSVGPFMRTFTRPPSPLHNGLHVTTLSHRNKSIKVRFAKWGRRTLKK